MSEENVELVRRAADAFSRRDLDGFDLMPDFTSGVVEVRDYGDDLVIAVLHNRGHGAEFAAPFESTTWLPARIRQGEGIWWGNFLTEEEALEAAGLRE